MAGFMLAKPEFAGRHMALLQCQCLLRVTWQSLPQHVALMGMIALPQVGAGTGHVASGPESQFHGRVHAWLQALTSTFMAGFMLGKPEFDGCHMPPLQFCHAQWPRGFKP